MSRPAEERAIVDAGLKAQAFDSGPPLICDDPAATYERASDEHGRLAICMATNQLGLGDKIRLIPGHCDPTVNLYDLYAIVDAGLKARAFDTGPPLVCDERAATYERASDEHGRLAVSSATSRLGLGDNIRLIPGHCNPTVIPHPSLPRARARAGEG